MTPFGKYQLIKKLATGGMAEVFLARQPMGTSGDGRHVVVKRILPHLADDPAFLQMFQNEARVASQFSHPNIAQIFEYGEVGGTWFIAMELVHGEDLGRLMRRAWDSGQWVARPLAIRMIANACDALHYAHARQVVHRDISPQNILISFDGSVKVVDFGIAKKTDQSTDSSGGIKGKFAYLAPEQANSQPLDGRTDVFALGLVLYELLTGVRPLRRDNELATLQAAMACEIAAPSVAAEVPEDLDGLVMKALARSPADRYRDARAFQQALEEFLALNQQVASSAQISELMALLFADRLEEEKKLGAPSPAVVEPEAAEPTRPAPFARPRSQAQFSRGTPMPDAPPRVSAARGPKDRGWAAPPPPSLATPEAPPPARPAWPALLLVVAAIAGGAFWFLRTPAGPAGRPILLSVSTVPPTEVRVIPADPVAPERILGTTPFEGREAMLEDTFVLENQALCVQARVRLPLVEPDGPRQIKRDFAQGRLKVTTTPGVKGLSVRCFGKAVGSPGAAFAIYEGSHALELTGDALTAPVPFEVTIEAGKPVTRSVDVSASLR